MSSNWETMDDEPHERVRRRRVPGGWLYQVEMITFADKMREGEPGTLITGWHPPIFVAAREVTNG